MSHFLNLTVFKEIDVYRKELQDLAWLIQDTLLKTVEALFSTLACILHGITQSSARASCIN
ncbi:hypothetical protein AWH60_11220 [Pseudoalteromonas haloplanktis]|nr:hypothetical protein AWH60_11220 [Pseudoalteromonas haloplanktis]